MKRLLSYIATIGLSAYLALTPNQSYSTSVPNYLRRNSLERKFFIANEEKCVRVQAIESKPTFELPQDFWQGEHKESRLERNVNRYKPVFLPPKEENKEARKFQLKD